MPRPVSELNTSAGKALLPGFADDDDSEDLVGNTIGEVKGLFQDCERKLKELIKTKSEGSQDEVSARFAPVASARSRRYCSPQPLTPARRGHQHRQLRGDRIIDLRSHDGPLLANVVLLMTTFVPPSAHLGRRDVGAVRGQDKIGVLVASADGWRQPALSYLSSRRLAARLPSSSGSYDQHSQTSQLGTSCQR